MRQNARAIRERIFSCLEKASQPVSFSTTHTSSIKLICLLRQCRRVCHSAAKYLRPSAEQINLVDRAKLLHWCIVGGGPTGIELAAELHDLAVSDVKREYPSIHHLIKITVYVCLEQEGGFFLMQPTIGSRRATEF